MAKSMFIEGGQYYKGNLHGHTVLSDGQMQPEEYVAAYKAQGYSFIVISDHELYFDSTEYDTEHFLVYPGIEWAVEEPLDGYKGHHIHGIAGTGEMVEQAGDKRIPHRKYMDKLEWKSPQTVQRAVDILSGAGNLTIYNHPIWSRLKLEDLLNVRGCFAVEIYNWNCMVWDGTGLSTALWDEMLRRGHRIYGVAADDSHGDAPYGSPDCDNFGGWIVVVAKALTREAIAEALVQGSFYSSCGPEIYTYIHDGDRVHIECSPVKQIRCLSYERRGSTKIAKQGEYLRDATFKLGGDEIFVRIECVDEYGKVAWSNPVFLNE